jgi:acetyl esterase/lipase
MRRSLVVAVSALLLVVAAACSPLDTPPGAAPLRYRDPVFANVTTTTNITYGSAVNGSGQTVTLAGDMYEPTGDTVTQRPAIVWVHGGFFAAGDKTEADIVDESNTFAHEGYVNFSINYRVEPGGCTTINATCLLAIQEADNDAQTAVRFLRTNAAQYRIDPNRIAIGGTSAGAIAALNTAYNSQNPGPGDWQGVSSAVRAAQSISGAAIPTSSIGPGDPPTLLFHGTADPLVPYAWAQNTVNAATQAGLTSILVTFDGEGHVPYAQNRTQILTDTTNFFWWEMDLAHAAT